MKKIDFEYDIAKHEKFFYEQLSERQRRLFVALKAMEAGYYGVKEMSKRFDIHIHTVRRGKRELLEQTVPPAKKVRLQGGGRKKNSTHKEFA
jgi:transposase